MPRILKEYEAATLWDDYHPLSKDLNGTNMYPLIKSLPFRYLLTICSL